MKKKALAVLGAAVMMFTGMSMVTYAAENPTTVKNVVLTSENKISYTDGSTKLEDAFTGMAPGESRTVAIKIENQNSHAASFFVSGETTKALEEINESAKGGAYEVKLTIGKEVSTATSLLDTIAGGYSSEATANNSGLKDITELEDYQYLAELDQNEYTNIYLTIASDGEGMDSTSEVDYSNAVGSIDFNFRAYYGDEKEPKVITKYEEVKGEDTVTTQVVNRVVSLTDKVKTGDPLSIGLLLVVLAAGVSLVAVAVKRGKAESRK